MVVWLYKCQCTYSLVWTECKSRVLAVGFSVELTAVVYNTTTVTSFMCCAVSSVWIMQYNKKTSSSLAKVFIGFLLHTSSGISLYPFFRRYFSYFLILVCWLHSFIITHGSPGQKLNIIPHKSKLS